MQPLSKGSAFTWERDNKHYLITAWHNVSGRNPNTDKHLSSTAAEPNMLHGMFNTKGQNTGASTSSVLASVRTQVK